VPKPPGEADLRDLALRYQRAEGQICAMLADSQRDVTAALGLLAALRLLDHRTPVAAAYLHEHPKGNPSAVTDLAGSLHQRLDRAAVRASETARELFRLKDPQQALQQPLTAATDTRGTRWGLGAWAVMNTLTIGRHATSRGIADHVGHGNTVTISTGQCGWCGQHAGEAVIGTDPLPPYHPSCSCVATAA
jgi:hypothetical protein